MQDCEESLRSKFNIIPLTTQVWLCNVTSLWVARWPLVAICKTTISDKLTYTYLYSNWLICTISYSFVVWINTAQTTNLKLVNKCVKMPSQHSLMFIHHKKGSHMTLLQSWVRKTDLNLSSTEIRYKHHLSICLHVLWGETWLAEADERTVAFVYRINDRFWMAVLG